MSSAIENILRECVKSLGHEAALELVNSMSTTTTKSKKTTTTTNKRIPRMSPTISNQLKAEFESAGTKHEDKEFDKVKKQFVSYIDDLTDDDFSAKGLTEHMKDFVNNKPKTEEKPNKKEKEEKPKRARKTAAAPKKEELEPPNNVATIHNVDLETLQAIEIVSTPTGPKTGIYWDGDEGRWVKGPDAEPDEDLVELGFKKETYVVGEKSGRVYKESEDEGPDVFQGFIGVGEFKDMKMP